MWLVTHKKSGGRPHVPRAAILDALIAWGWIDSLPRSPVGKVLKKDLRAKYWQNEARKI